MRPLFLLLTACADDVSVTKTYSPPEIVFVEPLDGDVFLQGEAVTFRATITDAQDPPEALAVTWTSDLDGLLLDAAPDTNGSSVLADATLSVGLHAISVRALDTEGGESVEAIAIEVVGVGEAPDISFVRPLSGETGREGVATEVQIQVSDAQDEATALAVRLESDLDGALCTPTVDALGVASCDVTLTPGDHTLTATVTDTSGYDAEALLAFTVFAASAYDDDGDGWTEDAGDCDDDNDSVSPGGVESPDGTDEDCDGLVDETTDAYDDDGDGWTENDGDCDDTAASVRPDATEVCDAVDQDCDGVPDDGTECVDDDGDGYTELAGDCDDVDLGVHPGAAERVDGVDEDCDGAVDDGTSAFDDDADCACEASVCSGSINSACAAVVGGDCDDGDPNTAPTAPEWCNGADDDCDGSTDEDDAIDADTWYVDADGDGYGDPATPVSACTADPSWIAYGEDCDDADSDVFPGAPEVCDDQDNDCDRTVDEDDAVDALTWYLDSDGDNHGDPAISVTACAAPAGYVALGDDCDDGNENKNCPDW